MQQTANPHKEAHIHPVEQDLVTGCRYKESAPTHKLGGKRIVFLTSGSRCDIQPFIALASHMDRIGCNVFVLTDVDHVSFIQQFGLKVAASSGDDMKGMENDRVAHSMDIREKSASAHGIGLNTTVFQSLCSFKPDLLYAAPLEVPRGFMLSKVLNVPTLRGSLQPWKDVSKTEAEKIWLYLYYGLNKRLWSEYGKF